MWPISSIIYTHIFNATAFLRKSHAARHRIGSESDLKSATAADNQLAYTMQQFAWINRILPPRRSRALQYQNTAANPDHVFRSLFRRLSRRSLARAAHQLFIACDCGVVIFGAISRRATITTKAFVSARILQYNNRPSRAFTSRHVTKCSRCTREPRPNKKNQTIVSNWVRLIKRR